MQPHSIALLSLCNEMLYFGTRACLLFGVIWFLALTAADVSFTMRRKTPRLGHEVVVWTTFQKVTLCESFSCTAHSSRRHAFPVFHLLPVSSSSSAITSAFCSSCFCASWLDCGSTQALTQYIKLN